MNTINEEEGAKGVVRSDGVIWIGRSDRVLVTSFDLLPVLRVFVLAREEGRRRREERRRRRRRKMVGALSDRLSFVDERTKNLPNRRKKVQFRKGCLRFSPTFPTQSR